MASFASRYQVKPLQMDFYTFGCEMPCYQIIYGYVVDHT